MHTGFGVYQYPFCSETLSAVAGDCVAVIEMTLIGGAEVNLAIVVESSDNMAVRADGFDNGKIAIRDTNFSVGRCKLNVIANREVVRSLPVDADPGKPPRIIGSKFAGLHFDRKQIRRGIDRGHGPVRTAFDSNAFAATGVADHIVRVVMIGPSAVGSGHILALDENTKAVILGANDAVRFQLLPYG